MKRLLHWLCPVFFLAAAIAVVGALHPFTQVDKSMTFINWDTSVHVLPDGTGQPISEDVYSNTTDLSGTYRFTGVLPEGLGEGSLLFETTGASLTLSLNGEVIWRSESSHPGETLSMAQGTVPIEEGMSGELELTCTILNGSQIMFPPLLRFIPANLDTIESTALANRAAFPAGAAALALVLVFGIFLLSIVAQKADFSLIPLMFAMAGLILHQLVQSEGSYFLPQPLTAILGRQEVGFTVLALLLLYLLLNRNRHFWKYMGIASAWSAAAFLFCLAVSRIRDGYLSCYVLDALIPEVQAGMYNGLLYWLSLWLSFTVALISAIGVLRAFSRQEAAAQALEIKNHLVTESCHALQERIEADSQIRHELKHKLTVLDCLCQNQDLSGIRGVLDEMQQEQEHRTRTTFTGNSMVNAILQDAAARAHRSSIRLETEVVVPDELGFLDTDLCSLLMNLLDNALEAAAKAAPSQDRFIIFQMNLRTGHLVILCKNSFTGELKKDRHGNLLTVKEDTLSHGLGYRQMKGIIKKYNGFLRFHTENSVFILEAALRLPDKE